MTGMPASWAFLRAGRMALLSCASRIRTLAPFEMRVSTSVSCCSLLRLASASMYLPPAASTVFWMFGLSVRGPARLLEVVPRHADDAVGGGRRRPGGRRWGSRGPAPACRERDRGNRHERAELSIEH